MTLHNRLAQLRFEVVMRYLLSRNYALVRFGTLQECFESYPLERSLKGKTVVDVGCDYLNSPIYWRANGAAKVIGYEVKPSYQRFIEKRLVNMPWFEFRGRWDGEMPKADVFKIDAEGPEEKLRAQWLQEYDTWFVAVHEQPERGVNTKWMIPGLQAVGGRQVLDHDHGSELVFKGGRIP
jgi:hypothetical protein